MLNIPSEIKTLLHTDSVTKNFRVHFPNGERADLTNSNIISESVALTESLCSKEKLTFGLCEIPQISFQTIGVENIRGYVIECSLEVYCPSTITGAIYKSDLCQYVYPIPYGTFIVDTCKKDVDMSRRNVVAYAKFDFSLRNIFDTSSLENALTWKDENLFVSVNGLVKALTLTDDDYTDCELQYSGGGFQEAFTHNGTEYILNVSYATPLYDDYSKWKNFVAYSFQPSLSLHQEYLELAEDYPEILDIPVYRYGSYTNSYERYKNSDWYTQSNDFVAIETKYSEPYIPNVIYPFNRLESPSHDNATCSQSCVGRVGIPYKISILIYNPPAPPTVIAQTTSHTDVGIKAYYETPLITFTKDVLSLKPNSTSQKITMYGSVNTIKENVSVFDFSEILDTDIRTLLQGYCELKGVFGKINRNGGFELYTLDESFLPQNVLNLEKSDYSSVWYDDYYSKPIGRLQCTYKNDNNNTVTSTYDLITSYSRDRYDIYDISNNIYIKQGKFTEQDIQNIFEEMAENINTNISFMPAEISCQGMPYVECGDVLEVQCDEGNFVTIIETRQLKGILALTDEYESRDEDSAIASGSVSSGGSVANGSGMSYTVLWENPNIDSSFSAQTITLSESVDNFDYTGITYVSGDGQQYLPMVVVPKGGTDAKLINCTHRLNVRNVSNIGGTSMTFGAGQYYASYNSNSATDNNSALRPHQVLGFKN